MEFPAHSLSGPLQVSAPLRGGERQCQGERGLLPGLPEEGSCSLGRAFLPCHARNLHFHSFLPCKKSTGTVLSVLLVEAVCPSLHPGALEVTAIHGFNLALGDPR